MSDSDGCSIELTILSPLIGLFRIEHDYPSVEPPQYLRELSPELFRQEQARVAPALKKRCVWPKGFVSESRQTGRPSHRTAQRSDDGKPKVFS